MPTTVTFAEAAKLSQDQLVAGVIENIVTVNQAYQVMPMIGIVGNSLAFNRENVLGNSQTLAVGSQVTADAATTFTKVNADLTTIIGKAALNGLEQATQSNINDQMGVQIASKAKSVGRTYMDMVINGDSGTVVTEVDGLLQLVDPGQVIASSVNGDTLSFNKLDEGISLVKSKDGAVDFLMMNDREIRAYMTLLRSLGGATIDSVATLPNGEQVMAYRGIPMLRNDYMTDDKTQGTAVNAGDIFVGCWDDGTKKLGVAGLTAANSFGIVVDPIGKESTYDEDAWFIKMYAGVASFSNLGLSKIEGIIPA